MNILLSNSCNRRCPYCFAAERVSYADEPGGEAGSSPPFISRASFEQAIEFALKSRVRQIGILGGEPSTHPEFTELLEIAWTAGLRTKVFTNGLWRARDVTAIDALRGEHERKLSIVINVNHPSITSKGEAKAQANFLDRLRRFSALSYNLFDPQLDPAFLVDVVRDFGTRRHIRLGIAQPLAKLDSDFIEVADYPSLAVPLMKLVRECDRNDITIGFDCGFTLCTFTPEQIGEMVLAGCRFKASCGAAVDVGTDLSVWACFPLSAFSGGVYLGDFADMKQLVDHFEKKFQRLYRTGVLPACLDCRYLRRKQCSGGCAAHVYRAVTPCA